MYKPGRKSHRYGVACDISSLSNFWFCIISAKSEDFLMGLAHRHLQRENKELRTEIMLFVFEACPCCTL